MFSYKIGHDASIPETMARNSEIPEELGRVQFILSDKTGTLTQNEMIFKNLSMEHSKYDHTQTDQIIKILEKQCNLEQGPMADIFEKIRLEKLPASNFDTPNPEQIHEKKHKKRHRSGRHKSGGRVGDPSSKKLRTAKRTNDR